MTFKQNNFPTVFIIEDDKAVCESLQWLFESVKLNVEIFNEAASFLKEYDPFRYGCLLIDIRLPGMSGLQLQEQLIQRNNRIPVIMMTGHGDVTLAVRAMKLGAVDFILKPVNNDLLLEQIQKILDHSREKQSLFAQYYYHINLFTLREKEIMNHVIDGKSNKRIAADLGITMSTVEQHRFHLMKKMQVNSLAELVKIHTLVHC